MNLNPQLPCGCQKGRFMCAENERLWDNVKKIHNHHVSEGTLYAEEATQEFRIALDLLEAHWRGGAIK